jgi:hypothetical protein
MRNVAKQIVEDILADLTNRRGLRQEWEQIDDDIQEEIINKWRTIVDMEIKDLK